MSNDLDPYILINVLLVLIWVQAVCKSYKRKTEVSASKDPGPGIILLRRLIIKISIAIPLPSTDSSWIVVSYKRKHAHDVLVNHLVKLAQEKVWLGELTIST